MDLSWPVHGFQPCTLTHLIFAVSLKFLISRDFLNNALSYTDWHWALNLCPALEGMRQGDIAARIGQV